MLAFGALLDVLLLMLNAVVSALVGFALLRDYPSWSLIGAAAGVGASIIIYYSGDSAFEIVRDKCRSLGAAAKSELVAFVKRKILILALTAAWLFGIFGAPLLDWLPLTALVTIGIYRYLLETEVPASGLKSWAKARIIEIQEVNKWHLFWQITAVAVAAEIAGTLIGSPFAVATFFVICSPYVINRLIVRGEIASLKRVRKVIATGKLKEMERVYQGIDAYKFPKTEKALKQAILAFRAAAALYLELAAKNPKTRYYGSIFRAAAKNVLDGQYGVKFQFKVLGGEPEIFKNLDERFNFNNVANYEAQYPCRPRKPSADVDYTYLQADSDYKYYDAGLRKIISVMNAIVGEDLFEESSEGLSIIAERGCYTAIQFVSWAESRRGAKVLVQPVAIRICLECDYRKYTGYVVVHQSLARVPVLPYINSVNKAAQDLAIFYSITLGLPYEILITKDSGKHASKVYALMGKLKGLVIDELKGQAQDIAIEAVAEKFFGDNAELVAELIGECMKERASAEIAEVIAEAIVGQLTEEGINILSEMVSN